jgi:hypothetical protein
MVGGSTDCCSHTVVANETCHTISDFYDTADTKILHADGLMICSDKYAPPEVGEKVSVCPNYLCASMSHKCTGGASVLQSAGTLSKIECAIKCNAPTPPTPSMPTPSMPTPTPAKPTPAPGPSGKTHYGDPAQGCESDEEKVTVTGVAGDFCSPDCTSTPCPTDKPTGVTAAPQCVLQDAATGGKKCALVCSPSAVIKDQQAADAQCGNKATCKAIQTVGLCTYDDR